jgi:hypothetical protein
MEGKTTVEAGDTVLGREQKVQKFVTTFSAFYRSSF